MTPEVGHRRRLVQYGQIAEREIAKRLREGPMYESLAQVVTLGKERVHNKLTVLELVQAVGFAQGVLQTIGALHRSEVQAHNREK